jgi:type IV secretory pathway TrbD component
VAGAPARALGAHELAAGAGAPPEIVLLPGLLALVAGLAPRGWPRRRCA